MEPIKILVPTVPVAQPRQRHRVVKAGKASFVQNYTPKVSPVNAYKAAVQMAARAAYSGAPLEGPLAVDYTFVFPRPKSMIWKTKRMGRQPHTKKPDRDNLEKATSDALTKLLWRDDAQICDGRVAKCIAAGDEQPHVEITIQRLASWKPSSE